MTLIQPNKKIHSFSIGLLIAACIPIAAGTLWFIMLYNKTVDLTHRTQAAKAETERVESASAELKDAIFSLLTRTHLERLAEARGLVKETYPSYLTPHQWEFASHF